MTMSAKNTANVKLSILLDFCLDENASDVLRLDAAKQRKLFELSLIHI